jgi:hypothetical protein
MAPAHLDYLSSTVRESRLGRSPACARKVSKWCSTMTATMTAAAWRCLKGRFAGRTLSSLSHHQLLQLLEELRATDSQGARLMEAYLDRRSQGWRERDSGDAARDEPRQPHGPRGGMTINEAYDVLGLKPGAKKEEIRTAHRKLMMKSARINEAKDILLARK